MDRSALRPPHGSLLTTWWVEPLCGAHFLYVSNGVPIEIKHDANKLSPQTVSSFSSCRGNSNRAFPRLMTTFEVKHFLCDASGAVPFLDLMRHAVGSTCVLVWPSNPTCIFLHHPPHCHGYNITQLFHSWCPSCLGPRARTPLACHHCVTFDPSRLHASTVVALWPLIQHSLLLRTKTSSSSGVSAKTGACHWMPALAFAHCHHTHPRLTIGHPQLSFSFFVCGSFYPFTSIALPCMIKWNITHSSPYLIESLCTYFVNVTSQITSQQTTVRCSDNGGSDKVQW